MNINEYYRLVQQAYNELLAEGSIKTRHIQEEVESDKGRITLRAGFYIHRVNPNIGILEKGSGNRFVPFPGSEGYSVDLLVDKTNGEFWDITTDNEGNALPINGGVKVGLDLIPRWRQPSLKLAGLDSEGESNPPATDCAQEVMRLDQIVKDQQAHILNLTKQIETLHMEKANWPKPKNYRIEPAWVVRVGLAKLVEVP